MFFIFPCIVCKSMHDFSCIVEINIATAPPTIAWFIVNSTSCNSSCSRTRRLFFQLTMMRWWDPSVLFTQKARRKLDQGFLIVLETGHHFFHPTTLIFIIFPPWSICIKNLVYLTGNDLLTNFCCKWPFSLYNLSDRNYDISSCSCIC